MGSSPQRKSARELCDQVAKPAATHVGLPEADPAPQIRRQATKPSLENLIRRAGAGRQPRGTRLGPLVPEFEDVRALPILPEEEAAISKKWLDEPLPLQSGTIPKGSKILMVATKAEWGLGAGDDLTKTLPREVKFGVARSPQAFFEAAINNTAPA